MAISSYKVELLKGNGSSAYEKFSDIKSFPDLMGDPNTIETTTLSDDQQTFIPGIKTGDTLQFVCNYSSDLATKVKAIESQDTAWQVKFSDGSTFTFKGAVSMGIPGKGVDEVLELNLNIVPSTVVTFTAGA